MTSKDFKKINTILKKAYLELGVDVSLDEVNLLSEEYQEALNKVKVAILTKYGFSEDEYDNLQEKISATSKEGVFAIIEDTREKIKKLENTHIPTIEEIEKIANSISKKYIVEPKITNQIVKETIIEKPKIIETTRIINEKFNPESINKKIEEVSSKIPDISNIEKGIAKIKDELRSEFNYKLENNINILDMPNFRKLAMGLQAQIDANTSNGGGGTWGSITGTLSDQTDLQSALNAKQNTLTLGTTTQIPYMNVGGTDFLYSDNFKFDGSNLNLKANVYFGTDNTYDIGGGSVNPRSGYFATSLTAPYLYGGDKTGTTYVGYSGAILGGFTTHAVLDFFDNNVRIGEFYTTSSSFNFFTGTGSSLNFYVNNDTTNAAIAVATNRNITYLGNQLFGTDNTYDIGASGATRPRNIYIADTIRGASGLFTTQVGSGSTGYIFFSASTTFHNRSDGVLTLSNYAENDFGRLQFGGTTSSFPAIKRNATGIDFRLADDSGYAPITSASINVNGGVKFTYVAKTANYTITTTDYTINCTSGTFTVTLLTAVGITGQIFVIKNSGSGVVTLATTSSQTIDGGTTLTLNQYDSVTVQSDGANWIII